MEPVQIGRGDVDPVTRQLQQVKPQWSPSRSDGVTILARVASVTLTSPQWSPSRSDGVTGKISQTVQSAPEPQWSPSRSDGVTRRTPPRPRSWRRRNGARPDRTG